MFSKTCISAIVTAVQIILFSLAIVALDTGIVPGRYDASRELAAEYAPRDVDEAAAADGDLDPDFVSRLFGNGKGFSGFEVTDVAIQVDGKIVAVGGFLSFASRAQRGIARLNADGSPDYAFFPVVNGIVSKVALQGDGKIVIAGNFTQVNGQARQRVARLNMDGTLDTTFLNPSVNDAVYALAIQDDGKIIVGGTFDAVGGVAAEAIARLTSTGGRDATFNGPDISSTADYHSISLQPGGKILVGGSSISLGTNFSQFGRLNPNGSIDTSFTAYSNGIVYSSATLADGRIIIAGDFNRIGTAANNTIERSGIARLQPNGAPDVGFRRVTELSMHRVHDFGVLPDGRIILGGNFTYEIGGATRSNLARIEGDGTFDPTYDPQISGFVTYIYGVALQTDGKIVIGGNLTSVGSQSRKSLVRLNADASLDLFPEDISLGSVPQALVEEGAVRALITQPWDGKILVGSIMTSAGGRTYRGVARINVNGTVDPSFQDPAITDSDGLTADVVRALAVQPADKKILVGGEFQLVGGVTRRWLARFHANGSLDTSFNPVLDGSVTAIAVQADGKIMIGGNFRQFGTQERIRLARLNADGSLDPSFNRGSQFCTPHSVDILPDGKILACGSANSTDGLERYNPDGSFDTTWTMTHALSVTRSYRTPDGKIIIIGGFFQVAGAERKGVARLNSNGTLDTSFAPVNISFGTIYDAAVQTDGKVIIAGSFPSVNGVTTQRNIGRLNTDGTRDSTFNATVTPTTGAGAVYRVWLQADKRLLLGGDFTEINGIGADYIARLLNGFTPACSYAADPENRTFTSAAATSSFIVVTGDGCAWTASSSAPWVTITAGANGTGSGTINFAVAANTTNAVRTATIDFGGPDGLAAHTIIQQPTAVNPGDPALIAAFNGPPRAIPDNVPGGVNIPLPVVANRTEGSGDASFAPQACTITDVNFKFDGTASADANATTVGVNHSWIGDLTFKLTSPAGTTVTIIDRPGFSGSGNGCNSNNLAAMTLDDDGGFPSIENQCGAGDNAAFPSGTFAPNNPLSAFDGQSAAGDWTLNVADSASGDSGSVRAFSLVFSCAAGATPTPTPAAPSPTPTIAPSPTPTVAPSPTPTVAPSPTVSPSPTPIVRDGGFEQTVASGTNPFWTSTSTNFGTSLCLASACGVPTAPRTGTGLVWFDGAPAGSQAETGSVQQSVVMPAGGTVTLLFYLRITAASAPADSVLTVRIDNTVVETFTEPGASETVYTLRTVDLSAFANGQARMLSFNYNRPGIAGGIDSFWLDDVEVRATPAQTTASLTGRVTTPTGTNLRNVSVTLIDAQGVRTTSTTSSFGIFSFANVPTGQTYTMTVASKRYRFTPKTIPLSGNMTNVDFIGLE